MWIKKQNEDFILVFILLLFSGNPVITGHHFFDLALVSFAIFLLILMPVRRMRIITPKFLVIGGIFGCIIFFQSILFAFFPVITIAGFYTRLFIGYGVFRLVRNFPLVYVIVMFYLAILSMIFYLPREISIITGVDITNIFGSIEKFIGITSDEFSYKLLFHTYPRPVIYQHRNAGMFWEPGAFSGYLIMALVFLAFVKNNISRRTYLLYLIVFSGTLFTTLSTTGLLIYPLVLLLHFDWQTVSMRKSIRRLLVAFTLFPIMIFVYIYSYQEIDFLQNKITRQLQKIESREDGWYKTRFGSIIFDWEYVKRSPLIGWGLHSKTRYSLHPSMEDSEGMGNGFTDFIAKFGISGMFVFLIALYLGMIYCNRGNRIKSLLVLLIILLVLQGEPFLGFPFFMGLMFLNFQPFARSGANEMQCLERPYVRERSLASEVG